MVLLPAYNEYRKSAKKTAYRSDLLSLHKGWLAFGVELDSFCERETTPVDASISNVGMVSLTTSKLYGASGTLVTCASCTAPGDNGTYAPGHMCGAGCTAGTGAQVVGPGKSNFIGFGDETCGASVNLSDVLISDNNGALSSDITDEDDCDLQVTTYEMGVAGHISGETFFGQHITHEGVLSSEDEDTAANVDPQCA